MHFCVFERSMLCRSIQENIQHFQRNVCTVQFGEPFSARVSIQTLKSILPCADKSELLLNKHLFWYMVSLPLTELSIQNYCICIPFIYRLVRTYIHYRRLTTLIFHQARSLSLNFHHFNQILIIVNYAEGKTFSNRSLGELT